MARSSGSGHWAEALRESAPYLDLGWRIAASLLLFTGAGYLLDQRWNTLPWLTVAGGVLGVVSVFVQIFRLAAQLSDEDKDEHDASSQSPR